MILLFILIYKQYHGKIIYIHVLYMHPIITSSTAEVKVLTVSSRWVLLAPTSPLMLINMSSVSWYTFNDVGNDNVNLNGKRHDRHSDAYQHVFRILIWTYIHIKLNVSSNIFIRNICHCTYMSFRYLSSRHKLVQPSGIHLCELLNTIKPLLINLTRLHGYIIRIHLQLL